MVYPLCCRPRNRDCAIVALGLAILLPALAVGTKSKKDTPAEHPPVRATLQPSFTIAAEPLGFSPPAAFFLGARNSLISLDFLDENRLLFTFRVPGLIHRTGSPEDTDTERKIRAVVLHLPDGAVQAEAVWTLHDRDRYLYALGDGQFLLRDGSTLRIGDGTLQLKPYLQFPGPVQWVEVDPSGQYLVTGSSEPPTQASGTTDVPSPAAAKASVVSDTAAATTADPSLVLRILRLKDGKVMMVSHVGSAVHLPINGEGFLELRHSIRMAWTVNFDYFTGGATTVGSIDSACSPMLDFLSKSEFVVTACSDNGDPRLVAMGLNGHVVWENRSPGPSVWPLFVPNASGTRVAREALVTDHVVNPMAPLYSEDIKGQDVQILDAATGKLVLRAAASPTFDAGGNVAVSPSGRRAAIMMDGNLQMFDLPAPPPLPDLDPRR